MGGYNAKKRKGSFGGRNTGFRLNAFRLTRVDVRRCLMCRQEVVGVSQREAVAWTRGF